MYKKYMVPIDDLLLVFHAQWPQFYLYLRKGVNPLSKKRRLLQSQS